MTCKCGALMTVQEETTYHSRCENCYAYAAAGRRMPRSRPFLTLQDLARSSGVTVEQLFQKAPAP